MKSEEINLNKSQVCCIGDLHIGVHQNSNLWHDTAIKWATWLKQELIAKNIKDIVILGDVYHYRDEIAVNTIHIVNQILKEWENFNIVILVGNHDSFYKDRTDINSLSILNGWKNIRIISNIENHNLYGKKCTFLPWGADISNIETSDIIFGHLEIESFKMNLHKLCDHGLKTKDLLDKGTLIMTGHFHLRDERKYNDKTIVYVGNPFEMDFGDIESSKGYYILDIPNLKYDFHENALSPKHKKISISNLVDQKASKSENLKAQIENNIIKLIIDKKISSDTIDALIQKISSYKPFSLSVDYSLYDDSIAVIDDQNFDLSGVDMNKAIEEFVNLLDIENKNNVSKYCLDLYKKALAL